MIILFINVINCHYFKYYYQFNLILPWLNFDSSNCSFESIKAYLNVWQEIIFAYLIQIFWIKYFLFWVLIQLEMTLILSYNMHIITIFKDPSFFSSLRWLSI